MNTFTFTGHRSAPLRTWGVASSSGASLHFLLHCQSSRDEGGTRPSTGNIARAPESDVFLFVDFNALFSRKWKILCHIFYLIFFAFFFLFWAPFPQKWACAWPAAKLIMDERRAASCRVASRRNVAQLTLFLIPSCPLSGAANEACKSPNQDEKRNV